jgi:hypothetical protein
MDLLIRNSEAQSITGSDLVRMTRSEARIMSYSDLEGVASIDQLFESKSAAIILYQTRRGYGHWVALTRTDNLLTFFDPYGMQVDTELELSPFNLRRHDGRAVPHLSHLINQSKYRLIENRVRLQEYMHTINTCGRWCALWVRESGVGLKGFQELFVGQREKPDYYATALTLIL